MKRLVMPLVSLAFAFAVGTVVLTAPTVAVAHPGNTCNPPAGHGRSGCHRVTTSSTSGANAKANAAAKRAAAAARARAAAPKPRAAAPTAAPAPTPPASPTPVAVPAANPAAATVPAPKAPVPWWIALWHFLFG